VQGTEACQILNNNQWVSNVVVTESGGRRRVLADISPEGHRSLCELGFREFSRRLTAVLPDELQHEDNLEFRHVHGWITEGRNWDGKDNKPGILSWLSGSNRHRLLLAVGPEMVYFQGHFPGNPILPGIAQLHWAVGMAMSLLRFGEIPCEIKRLKFRNIIRPSSVLELELENRNMHQVEFRFASCGQVYSTGCLCFREEPQC
jgi:3-hydroxymyristoyl/3-hydroxydecanoyl-(acyl carrier protein) dehydratase